MRNILDRFYEIYSSEGGLRDQIIAGNTSEVDSQFYNINAYFATEIPGVAWMNLSGSPVGFRATFNTIQSKLEKGLNISQEELDEFDNLFQGVLA